VPEENEYGSGYTIFYDEEDHSFGLGMKNKKEALWYLADYGSFLVTLKEGNLIGDISNDPNSTAFHISLMQRRLDCIG
jgi:hypothetical protein